MWTGFGITESMFRFRDECKRTSLFLGRAEVVEIKYHDTYNNQMVHQKAHKENVAIFDREKGYAIWTNTDLEMVMEKVVKGIWSVDFEHLKDS